MNTSTLIADELLTEADVVRRIPGRDADVRAWLRGLRIARKGPTGIRLWRWAEVLARLPLEHEEVPTPNTQPQKGGSLRRASLEE